MSGGLHRDRLICGSLTFDVFRSTLRLLALAASATAVGLSAAACGASGPTSSPLNVVEAFDSDVYAGHLSAACKLLSTREIDSLDDVAAKAQTVANCPAALASTPVRAYLSTDIADHRYLIKAVTSPARGYPSTVKVVHVAVRDRAYIDVLTQDQHGHWLILGLT